MSRKYTVLRRIIIWISTRSIQPIILHWEIMTMHICWRAIQFFAPGIPQVYYVGMLAGSNDIDLMERTKNGRDINRHYYSVEEVMKEQKRPVVQKLKALMELRNSHPAFSLDGEIAVTAEGNRLQIIRTYQSHKIVLDADLSNYAFEIR